MQKLQNKLKSHKKISIFNNILSISVIILLGGLTALFLILYINSCGGFLYENRTILIALLVATISILCSVAIIFQLSDKKFVFRFLFVALTFLLIAVFLLYVFKITSFWQKFNSLESIKNCVLSFGYFSVIALIFIEILQVLFLPIPAILTLLVSVLLYGEFYGALVFFIGVFLGSILAFLIGKKLGRRAVSYLIGEKNLQKSLNFIKNKDKFALTFAFFMPFFPDDLLCFVAGLSSISLKYFTLIIGFSRLISSIFLSFSISGKLIPFNTFFGALFWIIAIILVVVLTIFIYKNGEKISAKLFLKNRLKSKKKRIINF